jgi:hypothetical protein
MSIGKLILHSGSAEPSLSKRESLIDFLRAIGLLGSSLDHTEETFFTGDKFLQLISFVGCSTNVCLTPKSGMDDNFCNLAVKGPLKQPLLVWGSNSRPPRCPTCKQPLTDWKEPSGEQTITCSQCGTASHLDEISWGKQAGYGRIFIEISNIFPGEARPVHDLLISLGKVTATEWSYFYTE